MVGSLGESTLEPAAPASKIDIDVFRALVIRRASGDNSQHGYEHWRRAI